MTVFDTCVQTVAAYPWFYLAVGLLIAVDAVVPLLPGESVLIACGVLAGTGAHPVLGPIIAVGGLGAVLGSAVSYTLGRRHGTRLVTGDPATGPNRIAAALGRQLQRNGTGAVVVANFLPGGRNAAALLCGATGYDRRRFTYSSIAGATLWAATATGAGYLGGTAFADRPLLAFGLPLGAAAVLTMAFAAVRVRPLRPVPAWTEHRGHPEPVPLIPRLRSAGPALPLPHQLEQEER